MGKEKKASPWIALESKISRYPVRIISIILLITGIFGYFMAGTKIDNDIMSMIPADNPTKIFSDKIKHVLGDSNGIVIALEEEKGFVNQETLLKIKALSEKIENMDNTIAKDQLARELPDFSEGERETLQGMLNELLPELSGADELGEVLRNRDTLTEYFGEGDALEKMSKLADNREKVSSLYHIYKRPTDERKQWSKRVRKVNSAASVDYVFSEYSDTNLLEGFLSSKKITSKESLDFANYLLEKSLINREGGQEFLRSGDMQRAALLFGMPQDEIARLQSFDNKALELFFSLLQKSPKQIKVSNLLDAQRLATNPPLELFLFQERMKSWSFYEKTLYSPVNEKVTMISVEMVPQILIAEKELLIGYIHEAVEQTFSGSATKFHISGDPVITALMGQYMLRDLTFLFPIVVLVMALFLYAAFRHWRGIALPMLTVVITVVWTLGTVALLGYSITFVAAILPVLMVAVGSAYGIHIIHHYYQDRALGMDKLDALKKTVHEIGGAVIMAGLTTIVGFGSLAANEVIPLKEFGIFTALGISYALIVSLIFIPALLRTGKLPKKIAAMQVDKEEYFEEAHGLLGRILEKIGHWTVHRHK